jgi:hypothetical protein
MFNSDRPSFFFLYTVLFQHRVRHQHQDAGNKAPQNRTDAGGARFHFHPLLSRAIESNTTARPHRGEAARQARVALPVTGGAVKNSESGGVNPVQIEPRSETMQT